MLKAAKWQLENPKHNIKDWTNGAFYAGVFATWETTKSNDIYSALMDLGDKTQWQPYHRYYLADDVAISQTYLDIYQVEKKQEIIRPTIDTIRRFIDNPYPVKGSVEIIKWWWCDALFMAPPVMTKLYKATGNMEYLTRNDEYFNWRASLLDPDAYPGGEVSGSGFNCYALAWGINNKLLDKKEYLPVVKKAWISLSRCVNEEGRVGWVQPIGGDPQRNFSEDSWEVYGTGAFLLAGSEVIKLPKK
jgi:rhamnogalacturonyl hydrolase YesR